MHGCPELLMSRTKDAANQVPTIAGQQVSEFIFHHHTALFNQLRIAKPGRGVAVEQVAANSYSKLMLSATSLADTGVLSLSAMPAVIAT